MSRPRYIIGPGYPWPANVTLEEVEDWVSLLMLNNMMLDRLHIAQSLQEARAALEELIGFLRLPAASTNQKDT